MFGARPENTHLLSLSHTRARTHTEERENMDAGASGGASADIWYCSPAAAVSRWSFAVSQRYQYLLDKSNPYVRKRWIAFAAIAIIYVLRVVIFPGFYLVSYALGIYILNLLIGFLSPQVDPQFQDLSDGPSLPTRNSDEFRPFVRRLPEFKFWYSITKAFCIAFVMTFFSIFDVPVFWPILLFYFVMLFTLTMKRQILHMIKYRYVPFSVGKQRYDVKDEDSAESTSLLPRD
ncbi:hypothetical protein ACSBR2_024998 [Camellia fascicularis]